MNCFNSRFSFSALLSIFLLLLTTSSAGAQTPTLDSEQSAFLTLINNYRSQNGAGPLQVSIALQNSSQWMSTDMANKNYFSHTDSLGRDPFTRMAAFGYSYAPAGENIAAGNSDAQNSFTQWVNACDADATGACTYAHRQNMLNPSYQVIGIGRAYNAASTYKWYWTTDFGGVLDQTITPGATPVIASFTANPSSVSAGQATTLSWSVSGATSITLDNGIGDVTALTSKSVAPVQTTTYKLTASNGTNSATATVTVTLNAAVDVQPPSVPTLLSAVASGPNQVIVTWTPSTDNVQTTGYQILRNGSALAYSATTSYTDNSVTASTTYSYTIKAHDAAGNFSAASNAGVVTTPASQPSGPPPSGTPFINGVTFSAIRNNYTGWVGFRFTVGPQNLTVNALGRIFAPGNSATHIVKIVNATTGADFSGGSVSLNMAGGTASQFKYASLASPIVLAANTAYLVVSQETNGGDQWYDYSAVAETSVGSINGPTYWSGTAWVPVQVPHASYVPVSFLYTASSGGGTSNPPTISITSPLTAAAVSGTIAVIATAQASAGLSISSIQYRVDNTAFTPPLNTTTLSNGSHTLTAIATDSAGAQTTSAPVAITVNNGSPAPSSSTLITGQTLGTLRNNFGGFLGMKFTTGASTLTVKQLGRICVAGNSGAHVLKLVAASSGADVAGASATVSMAGCAPGLYQYAALASAVTLAASTAYYLVSQEAVTGDQWYDYSPVTAAAGAATVNGPVYFAGNGYYLVSSPGYSYVPVNLQYSTGGTPPSSTPPSVSVTSPTVNATVAGTILLSATATAAAGATISNVQYKLNGANLGAPVTGSGPLYSTQLDTTTLGNATYQLTAVATDSLGASATSAVVTFTVSNAAASSGTPLIVSQQPGTTRNNFTGFVGMKFTTSGAGLRVSSLGRMCVAGNNGVHTLKLVTASGSDVAGGSVSISMSGCTPGAYRYAALPATVQLAGNTAYYLVSQETAAGDQWYDYGPVTSSSAAAVNGPVYLAGTYSLVPAVGYSYVPVNLLYQ